MATARQPAQKMQFDREPPQNIEAERSVLGAMLIDNDAVGATLEVLHGNGEDLFLVEAHQHIYSAVVELFRSGQPVDPTTVVGALQRAGKLEEAGGGSYIAELLSVVPTSANAVYYAKDVLDKAVLRNLISTCTGIVSQAYEGVGEVESLLDSAESSIFSLAEQRQTSPIHKVSDLLSHGIHQIEELIKSRSGLTGLPTGLTELDKLLSGLQPSDMVVLAARPSVGKTAFALNIAAHAANRVGKAALIFSLEMSKEQLVQRLLCLEGEVNARRLREGYAVDLEFQKIVKAADVLSRAKIFVDDTPSISVLELRSKARRLAASQPLDLIIIDYLQLMRGGASGRKGFENRQVEIAEISRSVKAIARELSVPVLTLCQLNREAEKDDAGIPKLSHLRESGAIEQDADVVIMLGKPPLEDRETEAEIIRVHVVKQRNGPTGSLKVLFNKSTQRVRNLDESAAPSSGSAGVAYDPDLDYPDNQEDDEVPF
jgi:replicative DNA helicase